MLKKIIVIVTIFLFFDRYIHHKFEQFEEAISPQSASKKARSLFRPQNRRN